MDTTLNIEVFESTSNPNAIVLELPDMPYRGLEPFRYVDSPIFFAREREVHKLLRYITIYRGVLFYGDSGTGKSSLINAGLIPELIKEGYTPDRIRVQPVKDNELIIERISQTTNGQPPYLPSSFANDENLKSLPARIVLSVKDLKKSLKNLPSDKLPLLIFDQFEEIVTLFEEERVGKNLEESLELQKSILHALIDLISEQTLPVKLLFVFREDYLAKLHKFLIRCPDLTDQFLRLTSPGLDTLDAIIRYPFKKFPGRFRNEFSDELISNLETQLKERNEVNTLNLSEVQIVCLKLWQSGAPEDLLEKRKVEGLLEDFLNEALNKLPKDLYEISIALLRRMVTSSGTQNVVSDDDLIVSVKEEGFKEDKIKKALEALTEQTRLVRRETRHKTYFYQIVSEFLVPWIRRKQQEQKAYVERRKILSVAAIVVGFFIFIAIIMGFVAYWINEFRTVQAIKDEKVNQAMIAISAADGARSIAEQERDSALRKNEEIFNEFEKVNLESISELERLINILSKDGGRAEIVPPTEKRPQLKDLIKELESLMLKLDSEKNNMSERTTKLERQISRREKELKNLKHLLDSLDPNKVQEQKNLNVLQDENRKLQEENKRLKDEIEKLKKLGKSK